VPTSTSPAVKAPWFGRLSQPILFLTVSLALVGVYFAFSIPISVFPNTDFPRVVIGVDNGVMPIDQMLVTITRPVEEAVNSVPGLQKVTSVTSRGSAEIDLYFDWKSDMILTLQRVDAVVARLQAELPATARVDTHRLTFAVFPIIGYGLTSDKLPPNRLWEIATYDLKPRINRLDGVATVIVQGGRVPEFQVTPDPARLLAAGVTVSDMLDAIRKTNIIDSPGLIEHEHQLVLGLISGQVRSSEQISQIVVKNSAAGIPLRLGDIASVGPSMAPVYTVVTLNGTPAVLLNIDRQPESNTLQVMR
jgi:multidrug efflux pump subunit AcrB